MIKIFSHYNTTRFSYPFFINNLNFYNFSLIFFMLKSITLSEVRLKRVISANIKNLIDVNSYRGARHAMFLPVRGQRTRTNSGTRRAMRIKKDAALWN